MAVNMKNLRIYFLVLIILGLTFISSCLPHGPSSNRVNCSMGGEVCITIDKVQPFTMGEPMLLRINVSSTKDFSDLHVTLQTTHDITVDGPNSWENFLTNSSNELGFAYWNFPIKAGQTLSFNRILRFPREEGFYFIYAEVVNKGRTIDASENLSVLLEQKGAQVIMGGTPFPPYTPNATMAAYGPGTPAPTFITAPPTQTPFPTSKPPSTPSSPLLGTFYPPPLTPTPTSTPTTQSSPYP